MADKPNTTEEADQPDDADRPDQGPRRKDWTTAERTTFLVSLVIVIGLIVIAGIEYINRPAEATAVFEVAIEADQTERRDDVYVVPFAITNTGGSGAVAVTVRFEVTPRGEHEPVDMLTIMLDVLPVRAVEEGELLLSHDPATHDVTGRVESYLLP